MFSGTTDAVVDPAFAGHGVVIPDVATIEHQWRLECRFDSLVVRCSEFRPLGTDDQGIGIGEGFVHVLDNRDIQAVFRKGVSRDGVEGCDGGTSVQELRDDGVSRGLSDIISIGFECQSPDRQVHARKIVAEVLEDSFDEPGSLGLIDIMNGLIEQAGDS